MIFWASVAGWFWCEDKVWDDSKLQSTTRCVQQAED